MALEIKPIVDFAFKKIFGRAARTQALIGLLNAVLCLPQKIVEVQILNPFNYQDFADDKLIVLDIRAHDAAGRWLNVEMQLDVKTALRQRLVYYACSLYTDQLEKGDNYSILQPAYSICLLCDVLFADTAVAHHRFQLADLEEKQILHDTVEVHTVELTKYNLEAVSISQASPIEQWAFFLLCADCYEADELRKLLPGNDFQEAISAAESIREKTKDRMMYDQREKAQRDYLWAIEGAREEALKQGLEQGLERGLEQGLKQGLKRGRKEGMLIGKIELLRQLLGEEPGPEADLENRSVEELSSLLADLQERLRRRGDHKE